VNICRLSCGFLALSCRSRSLTWAVRTATRAHIICLLTLGLEAFGVSENHELLLDFLHPIDVS
jgi:hypothetical protein